MPAFYRFRNKKRNEASAFRSNSLLAENSFPIYYNRRIIVGCQLEPELLVEEILSEADEEARTTAVRISADELFGRVRATLKEK